MERTVRTCRSSYDRLFKIKPPGKLMKGVIFHQDNSPEYKTLVSMATLRDYGFELLDQSHYSLDLFIICFPTWTDTWLWTSIVVMMTSFLLDEQFFLTVGLARKNSVINKEVLKFMNEKFQFYQHSFIVCLCTFQSTIVYCSTTRRLGV